MQTVTVFTPLPEASAANHVHVLLGKSAKLDSLNRAGTCTDGERSYLVTSGRWTNAQIAGVGNPAILHAPHLKDKFTENGGLVDRAECDRAQHLFVLWSPDAEAKPDIGRIVAIVGMSGQDAIAAMGVQPVSVEG